MGRDTTGVKGIELGPRDELIGMVVIKREANLLVVTEKGMGKCSPIDEYRVQKRGGKGIITVHRTDKTGDAVSIKEVLPDDELMLITKQGIAIRMPVKGIRVAGRNTQGVRLVNLDGERPGDGRRARRAGRRHRAGRRGRRTGRREDRRSTRSSRSPLVPSK